jgi:DNA-binding LytR/AlgR family response regulator
MTLTWRPHEALKDNAPMNATALIAEDEPILAQALSKQLQRHWPELQLLPVATDGGQAVDTALAELPDVLFMDIQMPVKNGLDAAEQVMDQWPASHPLPLLVFVTAYDEYAVAAFERSAVDYVLKPIQSERLAATCERLARLLKLRALAQGAMVPTGPDGADQDDTNTAPDAADQAIEALRALQSLAQPGTDPAETEAEEETPATRPSTRSPLKIIQVAIGNNLRMVPVDEVLYFEAADKYVRLVTANTDAHGGADLLIRTPLRELVPRLDGEQFWQVHRSIVVNVFAIERVNREHGRLRVHIKGRSESLEVSRMYSQLFKAM